MPGFLSDGNGPTHQAIEDVALMRDDTRHDCFCPADEQDMLAMLPEIWASPHPAYVRLITRPQIYNHEAFSTGKAEIMSEGEDVTILTYGLLI